MGDQWNYQNYPNSGNLNNGYIAPQQQLVDWNQYYTNYSVPPGIHDTNNYRYPPPALATQNYYMTYNGLPNAMPSQSYSANSYPTKATNNQEVYDFKQELESYKNTKSNYEKHCTENKKEKLESKSRTYSYSRSRSRERKRKEKYR